MIWYYFSAYTVAVIFIVTCSIKVQADLSFFVFVMSRNLSKRLPKGSKDREASFFSSCLNNNLLLFKNYRSLVDLKAENS